MNQIRSPASLEAIEPAISFCHFGVAAISAVSLLYSHHCASGAPPTATHFNFYWTP